MPAEYAHISRPASPTWRCSRLVGVVSNVRALRVEVALNGASPPADKHKRHLRVQSLAPVIRESDLGLSLGAARVDNHHLEHGFAAPLTCFVSHLSSCDTGGAPDSSASFRCSVSASSFVGTFGASISVSHVFATSTNASFRVTLTRSVVHSLSFNHARVGIPLSRFRPAGALADGFRLENILVFQDRLGDRDPMRRHDSRGRVKRKEYCRKGWLGFWSGHLGSYP